MHKNYYASEIPVIPVLMNAISSHQSWLVCLSLQPCHCMFMYVYMSHLCVFMCAFIYPYVYIHVCIWMFLTSKILNLTYANTIVSCCGIKYQQWILLLNHTPISTNIPISILLSPSLSMLSGECSSLYFYGTCYSPTHIKYHIYVALDFYK